MVLGLFLVALIMGVLLGIVGNVWVEFYLKYLSAESWMLDLLSSVVTLVLIGLCVFLTGMTMFAGAGAPGVPGAIKVERDFRVTIPGKFANQLDISPGDRVTVTVEEDRLVIAKRQ